MVLQKKLLNSWFDEFFSVRENFMFFHIVHCMYCRLWDRWEYFKIKISWKQFSLFAKCCVHFTEFLRRNYDKISAISTHTAKCEWLFISPPTFVTIQSGIHSEPMANTSAIKNNVKEITDSLSIYIWHFSPKQKQNWALPQVNVCTITQLRIFYSIFSQMGFYMTENSSTNCLERKSQK